MPSQNPFLVAVYLHGLELDPAEITRITRVEPTRAWRRGEKRISKGNTEITTKRGLWAVDGNIESSLLDEHLAVMLDRLSPAKSLELSKLPGVESARLDVLALGDLGIDRLPDIEFEIAPGHMMELGQMGLTMTITVGFVAP